MAQEGKGQQHRTPRGGEVAELAVESRALFCLIKIHSALKTALAIPRTGEQRRCDAHFCCAMAIRRAQYSKWAYVTVHANVTSSD
jgi:hypothetical protein